jgi:hypothetical protein
MSRFFHRGAKANHVSHLINEIKNMKPSEIYETYGITISPDGSVFDSTYNKKFNTVAVWAEYVMVEDEEDFDQEYGHGKQARDDYY